MNDIQIKRQIFAEVLAADLKTYTTGNIDDIGFPANLAERDPSLSDWKQISDESLQAAWLFVDEFFDAVLHDFDSLDNGWTLEKCFDETAYILEQFSNGRDLEKAELFRFLPQKEFDGGCIALLITKVKECLQTLVSRISKL